MNGDDTHPACVPTALPRCQSTLCIVRYSIWIPAYPRRPVTTAWRGCAVCTTHAWWRCCGKIAAEIQKKKKQIGHHARPRRESATTPLLTRAKQDQAQAKGPGQNRTRSVGGATTHARRNRQASESVPTQTRSGAGGCTLQTRHQAGPLRQDPNTETSCAKGTYGPGQLQGRAGTGQHGPWQQQRR